MKLNKEDFLNSELGSNLLECIESWDWALEVELKQNLLQIGARLNGKYIRSCLDRFSILIIISLEQTNVLEFAQKTKKIGL